MKTVPLADLHAGDKLARELRDGNGRLILARGTLLTPALINLLHNVEIKEVAVEPQGAESAELLRQRLADLEHRFTGHAACPYMTAIKQAVRTAMERGMGPAN